MTSKQVLWKSKKEFALKGLTSLLYRASLLVLPILFGLAVDYITSGNYHMAYWYAIFLLITFMVYRLSEIWNTHAWHVLYNQMYRVYTESALDHTYRNSIFSLSRISLSEFINILNNDMDAMCSFFCDLPSRLIRIVEFVIIFIYFFTINTYMGAASIVMSIVVFLIMGIASRPIERYNKIRAFSLDHKTSALHELLLCIKEIKTFHLFEPVKMRIMNQTDQYTKDYLKQRVLEDIFRFGNVLLVEFFRICLFIYGIYLISQGEMQLGVLTVIYNYVGQIADNVSEFSVINNKLRNLVVSEKRYAKFSEYSRKLEDGEEVLNQNPKGEIIFHEVLYGYRHHPTLKDFNATFNAHSIHVILGPSGSGKQGVFDLLLRLNRQHEGTIKIDDIDIEQYQASEYFHLVASVFKEPVFFHMSIKDNLIMIQDDLEKMIETCKLLGIHDDIVSLENGYDTMITHHANNLSSKVRYLLGIARVLLKGSTVMLFDETLSSFDQETKEYMIQLLQRLKERHTILITSKDRDLLKTADQIWLIEQGTVSKHGTHKQLSKYKQYKNNISN